jgi:serine/threonine-protein kinase HipA
VSPANEFALLDRLDGDVAGALSLLHEGEALPSPSPDAKPRPLDDGAFAAILEELPRRPLLAGEDGLRLSLAGAQTKLPAILVDGRPALPAPGQPTTHIVKPKIPRFPGSVANEAWCMGLAARIGLDVAPAEAREAAGQPYLLVTRYDRTMQNGVVVQLHQEDACQALGIAAERKYAAEGGPAFRDLFALARSYARTPAVDVLRLVDAAIFNLAIAMPTGTGRTSHSCSMRAARVWRRSTICWRRLLGPSLALAWRCGLAGRVPSMNSTRTPWLASLRMPE